MFISSAFRNMNIWCWSTTRLRPIIFHFLRVLFLQFFALENLSWYRNFLLTRYFFPCLSPLDIFFFHSIPSRTKLTQNFQQCSRNLHSILLRFKMQVSWKVPVSVTGKQGLKHKEAREYPWKPVLVTGGGEMGHFLNIFNKVAMATNSHSCDHSHKKYLFTGFYKKYSFGDCLDTQSRL